MESEIRNRFTDTEMQIARETDLPELLSHLGYQVKRVGRFHTTAEMDSLRIKDRRTWFRYSQNTGGDAITFLQQFCGKSFPEAVEYLLTFHGKARDAPAPQPKSISQKQALSLPPRNADDRRVFAYLRKRGIAAQVIRQFLNAGLLYEDTVHHNCVFVGKNSAGQAKYAGLGGEDEEDTVILHIRVAVKDHLQMAEAYHFTTEQKKLLEELMQPEYEELFMRLTGSYQDIALSDAEVAEIMEKLPADLSEERKQVVLTAYQLLGKVNYFWGGKSLVLGWDSRWGTPMEVTAAGSSSSGTVRPFGLDCSGFVDWVFYNVTSGSYVIGHGGGASSQHSYCTEISWSDAQPGDLVFYPGDSHVGIVCGFDGNGNVLIIHCASGYNNVVVTGKSGFTSIARPIFYHE